MTDLSELGTPDPDRVLQWGPDDDHVADVWVPTDPQDRPVVVLVHGGFWRPQWDRTHTRAMAAALRDDGWPVVVPEYRRVPGDPDGTTADVTSAIEQVIALWQEASASAATHGIILCGHSAGGHLVLWAAAGPCPDIVGVVALAPVADMAVADELELGDGAVRAWLGTAATDRPDLNPAAGPHPSCDVTILHGTDDDRVPVEVSRAYAARNPAAYLRTLPDTDHFDLINPAAPAFTTLRTTLEAMASRGR